MERAAYYEQKEQPDRALAELRRIPASSQPNDLERTLTKIRLLRVPGQSAAALKETRSGLARHPGNRQLMLQLGLLYQPREGREALEQLCRDWSAREPASGTPYWLLGRQALVRRRTDEAIRLLTTAYEKEPSRADFCLALGLAYLADPTPESFSQARPWLEKALALDPTSPEPHQHLGRILEQTGDLPGARREYLRCLDGQPGRAAVLNNLSRVTARLGTPEVARLFAELARHRRERTLEREQLVARLRDHPADTAARVTLARFLVRNAQLTLARHHLERAAESDPSARHALADLDSLLRAQ
jgi:Flp pilus assembly protein TadD